MKSQADQKRLKDIEELTIQHEDNQGWWNMKSRNTPQLGIQRPLILAAIGDIMRRGNPHKYREDERQVSL